MSTYSNPPISSESVMFSGAQTGPQIDSTTAQGQAIKAQHMQERIRYDQPHVFRPQGDSTGNVNGEDTARGYNSMPADPAKYNVPSAQKDAYFTRQKVLESYGPDLTPMYQAAGPEEIALVEEMEAQQKIAQYDQYCASMFNYKNIPGGIEALERINPGFTSRRMAQIYSDAAFAAKTRAIEMIGQINCTQEDNIFKMHLDNGLINGPTLARERRPAAEYMPGNFAKLSRPTSNMTAMPGKSNQTGYRPAGRLPAVFGTGQDGIRDIANVLRHQGNNGTAPGDLAGLQLGQGFGGATTNPRLSNQLGTNAWNGNPILPTIGDGEADVRRRAAMS